MEATLLSSHHQEKILQEGILSTLDFVQLFQAEVTGQ